MPTTSLDLVKNVTEKKPSEFASNFSDQIQDRIRDLVAAKRIEIASNLFGPPRLPPEEEETPEPDQQEDDVPENDEPEQEPEIEDQPDDQETA